MNVLSNIKPKEGPFCVQELKNLRLTCRRQSLLRVSDKNTIETPNMYVSEVGVRPEINEIESSRKVDSLRPTRTCIKGKQRKRGSMSEKKNLFYFFIIITKGGNESRTEDSKRRNLFVLISSFLICCSNF